MVFLSGINQRTKLVFPKYIKIFGLIPLRIFFLFELHIECACIWYLPYKVDMRENLCKNKI